MHIFPCACTQLEDGDVSGRFDRLVPQHETLACALHCGAGLRCAACSVQRGCLQCVCGHAIQVQLPKESAITAGACGLCHALTRHIPHKKRPGLLQVRASGAAQLLYFLRETRTCKHVLGKHVLGKHVLLWILQGQSVFRLGLHDAP